MMKNKFVLIRYVLMLWLLCGASYTLSIASAYDRTSQSASWGYQPLYGSGESSGSGAVGQSSFPSYKFHSTSAMLNTTYRADQRAIVLSSSASTKSIWDDEPEGPGVGELHEPIGEPLVLLLFALAFVAFRYYRRRAA